MPNSFEQDSLGWRIQKIQQHIGEWWEWQTRRSTDVDFPDWLNSVWLEKVTEAIFWLIVALFIFWLAWQIWQWLNPYLYLLMQRWGENKTQATSKPKKELSSAAWLEKAYRFRQQENYYEACMCLYLATLQRLHERGIAPHQSSRTDGEYLTIVQKLPQPEPYQQIIKHHQSLCFAHLPASLALFSEFQQAYDKIKGSQVMSNE